MHFHITGRSGRAGRSGEAITFYTDEDIPFLRNIANVMSASGCEVPSWITELRKMKWKKHRPKRDSISTKPNDEGDTEVQKKKSKKHKRKRDSISTKPNDDGDTELPKKKSKKHRPERDSISMKSKDNGDTKLQKKKSKKHKPKRRDSVSTKPKVDDEAFSC